MAYAPPCDRLVAARTLALRRTIRARVAAAIAIAAVAWWARGAAAEGAAVRVSFACVAGIIAVDDAAANSETKALGASAPPSQESSAIASPVGNGWTDALRTGGALVVVLGIIAAGWWWARRSGLAPQGKDSVFEIVARHPVGRGQQILVARFGPRVLCLQQTREGLRTLCELEDENEVTSVLTQASHRRSIHVAKGVRTVDVREKARP